MEGGQFCPQPALEIGHFSWLALVAHALVRAVSALLPTQASFARLWSSLHLLELELEGGL